MDVAAGLSPRDNTDSAPGLQSRPINMAPLLGQAGLPGDETAGVRREVGATVGADLTQVPVDRGPSVPARAADMAAEAWTDATGVHIPPCVGPLDQGRGRQVLAHELAHAAQRQHAPSVMPEEGSRAGRMLERQAQSVAEGIGATNPPARTPLPLSPGAVGAPAEPLAPGLPTRGRPPSPPSRQATPGPARLSALARSAAPVLDPEWPVNDPTEPAPSVSALRHLAQPAGPGSSAPPLARSGLNQAPAMDRIIDRLDRLEKAQLGASAAQRAGGGQVITTAAAGVRGSVGATPGPGSTVSAVSPLASGGAQRIPKESGAPGGVLGSENPDHEELERLSRLLYPLFRFRLQSDLRRDRDRTGSLSDIYGRW